jgi:hypothetical protein
MRLYFFNKGAYADVPFSGHRRTYSLESVEFSDLLIYRFYLEKNKAPKSGAVKDAIRTLVARARYEGERHEVHLRIAKHGDKIYLDLGDEAGNVVEIGSTGWQVISVPPVRFSRPSKMGALPLPQRGDSIERLRPFVSNLSDVDFELYLSVLCDAFDPHPRPHPVAFFVGPDGATKTTVIKVGHHLIDPSIDKELRAMPRAPIDVFVNARESLVIPYDNVGTKLSPQMSDTLCQISSGTGFAKRKLYSDAQEIIICTGPRLIMLSSVTNVVTKPDLGSRLVLFKMEQIASGKFMPEVQFWDEFEQLRPRILGAILDRISRGLARIPDVRLSRVERMADFARWGTACETEPGSFGGARDASAREALADVIEKNPVALAIREFMADKDHWRGTTTQLLKLLENLDRTEERATEWKSWPRDPGLFGQQLWDGGTVSLLHKSGIQARKDKASEENRTRYFELRRIAPRENTTVTSDSAEAAPPSEGARESEDGALVPLRRVK